MKHFCKAHAVRSLVPPAKWEEVFESQMHYDNKLIARNSLASRAFVREWLDACLQRTLLASLPDSKPHADFQWHTHEQCLYSIVAALRPRMHATRFKLCYSWARPMNIDRDDGACLRPSAVEIRQALPTLASAQGHCLALECPELTTSCAFGAMALPLYPATPGAPCNLSCAVPSAAVPSAALPSATPASPLPLPLLPVTTGASRSVETSSISPTVVATAPTLLTTPPARSTAPLTLPPAQHDSKAHGTAGMPRRSTTISIKADGQLEINLDGPSVLVGSLGGALLSAFCLCCAMRRERAHAYSTLPSAV